LSPDVTGIYKPIGLYNEKPSYQIEGNGWFIWWDDTDTWHISIGRGTLGTAWWSRVDPVIAGQYINEGTANGTADVQIVV